MASSDQSASSVFDLSVSGAASTNSGADIQMMVDDGAADEQLRLLLNEFDTSGTATALQRLPNKGGNALTTSHVQALQDSSRTVATKSGGSTSQNLPPSIRGRVAKTEKTARSHSRSLSEKSNESGYRRENQRLRRALQEKEQQAARHEETARQNELAWEFAEAQRIQEVTRLQSVVSHTASKAAEERVAKEEQAKETIKWVQEAERMRNVAITLQSQKEEADRTHEVWKAQAEQLMTTGKAEYDNLSLQRTALADMLHTAEEHHKSNNLQQKMLMDELQSARDTANGTTQDCKALEDVIALMQKMDSERCAHATSLQAHCGELQNKLDAAQHQVHNYQSEYLVLYNKATECHNELQKTRQLYEHAPSLLGGPSGWSAAARRVVEAAAYLLRQRLQLADMELNFTEQATIEPSWQKYWAQI